MMNNEDYYAATVARRSDWIDLVNDAFELVKEPYRTNLKTWIRSQIDGAVPDADPVTALRRLDKRMSPEEIWELKRIVLGVVARTVEVLGDGPATERERLVGWIRMLRESELQGARTRNHGYSRFGQR